MNNSDQFGTSSTVLADFNGDGISDLCVGAPLDDDGFTDAGAVYVVSLTRNGTVNSGQKISLSSGNFSTSGLVSDDNFGSSVSAVSDLDGDGREELLVGTPYKDDGGTDRGGVYVLFLDRISSDVKHFQVISSTQGNFSGVLADGDNFGISVCFVGDLNNDGNAREVAVGASLDDDGGSERGAIWILFLSSSGKVVQHVKVSSTSGGFPSTLLKDGDRFGTSISNLGDVDGDGTTDLAIGAYWDDDGGTDRGAVYITFLLASGNVKSVQKISSTQGNFQGPLDNIDLFGISVCSLGWDVDGNGLTTELAVGSFWDDDGGTNRGCVWILSLNSNGMVQSEMKISQTSGGFTGSLDDSDLFGSSVWSFGLDLNLDGFGPDLVVGSYGDDDGGSDRGSAWILFMNGTKIASTTTTSTTTTTTTTRIGTTTTILNSRIVSSSQNVVPLLQLFLLCFAILVV